MKAWAIKYSYVTEVYPAKRRAVVELLRGIGMGKLVRVRITEIKPRKRKLK